MMAGMKRQQDLDLNSCLKETLKAKVIGG